MFGRLFAAGKKTARIYKFGKSARFLHKDDNDNVWLPPGGGLEKLQGGIKEEKYFNDHNLELLEKIRADGSKKFKCENCAENWNEFEKVANASIDTCSPNKNKICYEETYFINEQTEKLKRLSDKLKDADVDVDEAIIDHTKLV